MSITRLDKPAQFEQVAPVPAVARQPRSVKAEHSADQTGSGHHTAGRAAEIVVDHIHGPKTMTKCEFDHFILPLSVLGVAFVLAPVSPDTQAITVLSAANSNYVCIWVTRLDQPARLWSVSGSATPLVNPTPSMMQGNWFVPLSLRHFFDPPRTKVKTGWRNVVQSEGFIPARTPIRLR